MTTHHDIFGLILGETCGAQRDDVLQALCAAFCACYDNEQGDERPVDCEVLSDEAAHLYFVDCYYKALAPELRAKPRTVVDPKVTYMEVNPREVSVPEWATNHRRLLRGLAQAERKQDEAGLAYCRKEMTAV